MAKVGIGPVLLKNFSRSSTQRDGLIKIFSSNQRQYHFIVNVGERNQLNSPFQLISSVLREN
jgi:hypothetical protein